MFPLWHVYVHSLPIKCMAKVENEHRHALIEHCDKQVWSDLPANGALLASVNSGLTILLPGNHVSSQPTFIQCWQLTLYKSAISGQTRSRPPVITHYLKHSERQYTLRSRPLSHRTRIVLTFL